MRLIMMRHGETIWNAQQRLQGHDNAPLSARGRAQALAFRDLLRELRPKAVVSSDLGRCRETVALIGFPNAPADPRLRELNMGEWTGRSKPDLIAQYPKEYWAWRAGSHHPAGGECWHDFRARVEQALREWLARANGDLLAVVHSGVIRAALSAFLELPQGRIVPATPGTATMLQFADPFGDDVKLEGYNLGNFLPESGEAVSD